MVVVAIIGILASVAISNYRKYQAKARQSEARLILAAGYTAEQSFFASEGTYTYCLLRIGLEVPTAARRYYSIGFMWTLTGSGCGPDGTQAHCGGYRFNNDGTIAQDCGVTATPGEACFQGNSGFVGAGGIVTNCGNLGTSLITQNTFTIQALGWPSGGAATWDS